MSTQTMNPQQFAYYTLLDNTVHRLVDTVHGSTTPVTLDMTLGDVRLVLRWSDSTYTATLLVGDTHVLETDAYLAGVAYARVTALGSPKLAIERLWKRAMGC
jgi:hypothetical protein